MSKQVLQNEVREDLTTDPREDRWRRRVDRERSARKQAEQLLEDKSRALYAANEALAALANRLEARVDERTAELVSERERALKLANTDQLTGLVNRRHFLERLEAACGDPDAGAVQLFLVDVDSFRTINGTFGEEAGDQVLKTLGRRLCETVGERAIAARIGPDEFALICPGAEDDLTVMMEGENLSHRLRQPVTLCDRQVQVSCTMGVASFPRQAQSADQLLRFADLALQAAQKNGAGEIVEFTPALNEAADARRSLQAELGGALSAGEIVAWYQPIMDAASGCMVGVEALARWQHPTRGLLAPGQFIELAEEARLMDVLFDRVLCCAAADVGPLVAEGRLSYISVNVSPSQFRWSGLGKRVLAIAQESGLSTEALVLEITEELILRDLRVSLRELLRLSKQGVRVALDDFGTGYSNIAALKRLPVDWLKIDRSLIANIGQRGADQEIVRAVLNMARALSVEVIAEGVETRRQADWLAQAGCGRQQGFFYSRPMPITDLRASPLLKTCGWAAQT
ncbi:putative bifunctional diguanylate cyclase/phosphodiesterase [Rhizobium halophytocola]|uniref:Diguanylate cyclase (GGDEF)-like protein n=1 Tax=Rhizobium halophytocola TaxID=735519 RepID=A0ABS4E409_9HYPH|nr:bifunctional diguanylate cyclase/phosphodiesterase [Rhizobium halophytocola]MBP1852669.1 diguanylate cyclase (GGDEF)-like protein [Rhizobium halophytocola]